jgi:signal transduction histidine kinase
MPLTALFRTLYLLPVFIGYSVAHAQTPVSRLTALSGQLRAGRLRDTNYLKAVDSLAPLLLDDDSLLQRLAPYQEIAFGSAVPAKYRVRYYRYLALQAIGKNRYGSAIYYSEKNNEASIEAGLFEKNALPHSELFAISVYCTDKDFARAIAKYRSLRPRILGLAANIPAGKVSPEEGFVAFSILREVADAASQTRDTATAEDAVFVCRQLLEQVGTLPDKYKKYRTFYDYTYHCVLFDRVNDESHIDSATALLNKSIAEVRSSSFLPSMQPYDTYDTYTTAFDFYISNGRRDSARRYLGQVRDLETGIVEHLSMKRSFLLEGSSQIEALDGNYRAAYEDLRKAFDIKDSSYYSLSSDKDNNLYALAVEENTRKDLLRAEESRRRMEQFNVWLFFLLAFVFLAGLSGYFIVSARSKHRMLHLRLGMARNFHDEIGPLLLYANTLVKKEVQEHPSPRVEELRSHLLHVMEAVRGVTHDLKSTELATVGVLHKEILALLEKIRDTTQIDFSLHLNYGNPVLSHFQATHLRKAVNELISNSIKHGQCSRIDIRLRVSERKLHIRYSDNGRGMPPQAEHGGIGLKNVQERVGLLNGAFHLHNDYPKGYSIDIKIPLL